MEKNKCKHKIGWLITEPIHVFTHKDNVLRLGWKNTRYGWKVKMRCNRPSCNATRWAYIKGNVEAWGKIQEND